MKLFTKSAAIMVLGAGLSVYSVAAHLQTPPSAAEWVYHRVEAGKKDYQPGHSLGLGRRIAGYDLGVSIAQEDWYDPTQSGRDGADWLKAGGISYFSLFRPRTYPKNHLSALVGFRMTADTAFQVCTYVNDLSGRHTTALETVVELGDTVWIKYLQLDSLAQFQVNYGGEKRLITLPLETASRRVAVGPWHGGSVAAPEGTGVWTFFGVLDEGSIR